jgi:hypothetical protein
MTSGLPKNGTVIMTPDGQRIRDIRVGQTSLFTPLLETLQTRLERLNYALEPFARSILF